MTDQNKTPLDPFGRPLETVGHKPISKEEAEKIVMLRDAIEALEADDVDGEDLDMPLDELLGGEDDDDGEAE